jgi:hypothetical protein
MYHVELRQFPHNHCRFNLTDGELRVLVEPWAREQAVELDERKWSPHQARLTILEGPRLSVEQLSMGRGWRAAQRESKNVTEQVLAAARQPVPAQPPAQGSPEAPVPADALALGVQLAALLGEDPAGLLAAWRAVVARSPGLAPSDSLALAERDVARAAGSES